LEGDKWQIFAFGLDGETDLGSCVYQKIEVKPDALSEQNKRLGNLGGLSGLPLIVSKKN
jgi:hypothetical protein